MFIFYKLIVLYIINYNLMKIIISVDVVLILPKVSELNFLIMFALIAYVIYSILNILGDS